ncbi:MAG: hypothetical protein ACR65R_01685 [Methylomicrobium sp.]
MKPFLTLLPALLFTTMFARAEEPQNPNYCRDASKNQEWKDRVAKYPNDPLVIKLAGLRKVLCLMIDRGQITHAQGVDLWEEERQRRIAERSAEDAKWEKVLTAIRSFHQRENPAW